MSMLTLVFLHWGFRRPSRGRCLSRVHSLSLGLEGNDEDSSLSITFCSPKSIQNIAMGLQSRDRCRSPCFPASCLLRSHVARDRLSVFGPHQYHLGASSKAFTVQARLSPSTRFCQIPSHGDGSLRWFQLRISTYRR